MNLSELPTNLPIPENDGKCEHLFNAIIQHISLPNQEGNLIKLNRADSFRLVVYFLPR